MLKKKKFKRNKCVAKVVKNKLLILPCFSRGGPGLICCSVMIVTRSIPEAFLYRRHMVILNLSEHEPGSDA